MKEPGRSFDAAGRPEAGGLVGLPDELVVRTLDVVTLGGETICFSSAIAARDEAKADNPPRKTRYRVKLHLDGAEEATVTIERGTTHQLLTVRPLGKRGTYTMSLADVASMVAYRIAKNQAETLRLERKATPRRRRVR